MRGSISAGLCAGFIGENSKLSSIVVLISLGTTFVFSSISAKLIKRLGFL